MTCVVVRCEKGSIVLTSDRDRSEWRDTFGEALLVPTAASGCILDRVRSFL